MSSKGFQLCELLAILASCRTERLEDLRRVLARPESAGNLLRVEVLNLLTRCRTERLEDLRHVRASLAHGPESVGNPLRIEVLNLLARCRTEPTRE